MGSGKNIVAAPDVCSPRHARRIDPSLHRFQPCRSHRAASNKGQTRPDRRPKGPSFGPLRTRLLRVAALGAYPQVRVLVTSCVCDCERLVEAHILFLLAPLLPWGLQRLNQHEGAGRGSQLDIVEPGRMPEEAAVEIRPKQQRHIGREVVLQISHDEEERWTSSSW